MNIKPNPNHEVYMQSLKRMTPEQRLLKAVELSELTKKLFLHGLKKRFPQKNENEIMAIYIERVLLCNKHNY
jgi:hypothetical protein